MPFAAFYARQLPGIPLAQIDARLSRSFAQYRDQFASLPGVVEFCAFSTTSGRRLFVLSTIKESHFEHQAARYGIRSFFTRVYVGVIDKTQVIHLLLVENDLRPVATLFVGDMVHDIEAARRGGVTSVAVLTGFDPVERLAAGEPDLIVRDFEACRRFWKRPDKIIPTNGSRLRSRSEEQNRYFRERAGSFSKTGWSVCGTRWQSISGVERRIGEERSTTPPSPTPLGVGGGKQSPVA